MKGPVFGFAEAAEPPGLPSTTPYPSPPDTVLSAGAGYGDRYGDAYGGLQVVGFGQGPWSSGVPAAELLAKEFGTLVDQAMVAMVSGVLPGLWLPRPDNLPRDGDLVPADPASALEGLLDRIDDLVRELLPEGVGRGHNRSPEGLVEPEGLPDGFLTVSAPVRGTVLRATAEMRLALSSGDHPALAIAWQATLTAVKAIGAAVSAQIQMLYGDDPAATALRTGAAGLAISFIGMELDLIDRTGAAGIIVAAIGVKMLGRK